jgi:pyridoxal phosphate enzyme (YggS family)
MALISALTIAENLATTHARIAQAAQSCGRALGSVQLLAVSKTQPADAVWQAMQTGQLEFGENYVQEGVDKILAIQAQSSNTTPRPVWHLIGPLQSNKTKIVAEHFAWVQSVDRLKIAQRLSEQRPTHLPALNVCIQVNISRELSKSGVMLEGLTELANAVNALPRLRLRGLMMIPAPTENLQEQETILKAAHVAFLALAREISSPHFDTLSIGMSADLESAVAAGSTMVRIGTAIFGSRN